MAWVKAQHDVFAYMPVLDAVPIVFLSRLCGCLQTYIYLGALNADVGVLSPLPKSQGFAANASPQMAQQALNTRSVNELQAAAVVQKLIEQPWARSFPTN